MRIIRNIMGIDSHYVILGPFFDKSFEVGYQRNKGGGFSINYEYRTRGDHAGLSFSTQLKNVLFELSFYDTRHWNYKKDRFYSVGERETDGYPYDDE